MQVAVIAVRDLLEAGVHFGHESRRWNPKMRRFIFEERNGIHIIDLQQTQEQVEAAHKFIRETVASGKSVLFVGTKRQAKESIKEAAVRACMFYVTERWLGGLLTNIKTVRKSIGRLKEIDRLAAEDILSQLPKKEVASLMREKAKLDRDLTGIKDMNDLPGAIFIVDTRKEKIAVAEGRRLGIPIVALVDTNSDPEEIDYPIVCNDDAIRAIKLMADIISRACAEGVKLRSVAAEEGKKPRRGRKAREEAVEKEAEVATAAVSSPAAPEAAKAEEPASKVETPVEEPEAPPKGESDAPVEEPSAEKEA
jgi:small subunit ribosomal protein S2